MNSIINATNVSQCLEYLMELATLKWWQFRKAAILKNRIKNQFLLPMQADQRKVKPLHRSYQEMLEDFKGGIKL